MTEYTVAPSEWGHTAYHPSGRAVAHSRDPKLLDSYLQDLLQPPAPAAPKVPSSGPRPGPAGAGSPAPQKAVQDAPGLPLTEVTYTTRARSTGATLNAGRTATGFGSQCLNHGTLAAWPTKTAAENILSKAGEWCPGCARIAQGLEPKITVKIDPAALADLL